MRMPTIEETSRVFRCYNYPASSNGRRVPLNHRQVYTLNYSLSEYDKMCLGYDCSMYSVAFMRQNGRIHGCPGYSFTALWAKSRDLGGGVEQNI